jgi:DNA repair protein SbcD/Mre11
MRILHTADWHLGKTLDQFSLYDDQAEALEQLLALAARERPDAVVLAGDIYDRAMPPAEAVALFNRTVSRLVLDLGIPLLAIAGNHDNPDRVHYGAQLFEKQGFYVCGHASFPLRPVVLPDAHGPVYFYLLPYTEPETLRYLLRQAQQAGQVPEAQATEWLANLQTHQQVMEWAVGQIAAQRQPGDRTVLVAHAFAQGGEPSDSERSLLGGAELVAADAFAGPSYVALGHLHKPQQFLAGRVRYAGSPLKYSLSEASHAKSYSLVELDAHGQVRAREVPVMPVRNLWAVTGELRDGAFVLGPGQDFVRPGDYLHIKLLNDQIVPNGMATAQQQYPNTLKLDWPNLPNRAATRNLSAEKIKQMTEEELFAQFYRDLTEREMDPARTTIVQQIISQIRQSA